MSGLPESNGVPQVNTGIESAATAVVERPPLAQGLHENPNLKAADNVEAVITTENGNTHETIEEFGQGKLDGNTEAGDQPATVASPEEAEHAGSQTGSSTASSEANTDAGTDAAQAPTNEIKTDDQIIQEAYTRFPADPQTNEQGMKQDKNQAARDAFLAEQVQTRDAARQNQSQEVRNVDQPPPPETYTPTAEDQAKLGTTDLRVDSVDGATAAQNTEPNLANLSDADIDAEAEKLFPKGVMAKDINGNVRDLHEEKRNNYIQTRKDERHAAQLQAAGTDLKDFQNASGQNYIDRDDPQDTAGQQRAKEAQQAAAQSSSSEQPDTSQPATSTAETQSSSPEQPPQPPAGSTESTTAPTASVEDVQNFNNSQLSLDEQLSQGKITREQYDAKKNEIANTEAQKADESAKKEAEEKKKVDEAKVRDKEIMRKWNAKEPMTVDELTRYQELKATKDALPSSESISAEMDKLRESQATWTDTDKQKYAELSEQLKVAKEGELTETQIKEKNEQELVDMGTEFFQAFLDGDVAKAEELAQGFSEKLAAQQSLAVPEASKQQLSEMVRGMMKPENIKNPIESARMQKLKERFMQLSQLELRIRSREEQAKTIVKEIKKSQKDAAKAENDYYNETNEDERQKKLLLYQGHAMRVQSLIDMKSDLQFAWIKDDIDRRQILGQIHRQIGSKGLVRNLLWGARTAGTQALFAAEKGVSYIPNKFA